MRFWPRLRNKLRFLFLRRRFERELAQEIESHRELLERDQVRQGVSVNDAELRVRKQLGNTTLAIDSSRDAWTIAWLENTIRDIRISARGLLRNPDSRQ